MNILLITDDQIIKKKIKDYYKERYKHILIDIYRQGVCIYDLKRDYNIIIIDIDSLDYSGVIFSDLLKRRYEYALMIHLSKNKYIEQLFPEPPFFYMKKEHLIQDLSRLMYFYYGLDSEILRFKYKTRKDNRTQTIYQYFKVKDIIYVESKSRESIIHKKDGDTTVYMPIGEIEKQLNANGKDKIIRVHRCYLINLSYSQRYKYYHVYLSDSSVIPVGVNYRNSIKKLLCYATNNE